MFYKNIFRLLLLLFISISASNLTVLYISKTISSLQVNLRLLSTISVNLVIFIACVFFMYFAVIFFHYNKNYIVLKIKEFLNESILEKNLKKAVYMNNKYNSNVPGQDIVKNFLILERFFTKNIEKIFYLPWIFVYLYFLKRLNQDLFMVNILFIMVTILTKILLYLISKLHKNTNTLQTLKIIPSINTFYNSILINFDIFKNFCFLPTLKERKKDFFLYFLGFIKSVNVIVILIYSSLFIRQNLQNIIIIYILTNHIIFFLERILSFEINTKIREICKFFSDIDNNYEGKFFSNEKQQNLELTRVISAKNLYFKYHDINHFIIKNLSLDIFTNKIHLIVGENNSGKSTLIKLLCGSLNFEKGDLIKKSNKTICFCDDNIIFFERLNFLSNLTIFNENPEDDKKFLDFLIKEFNLLEDIKYYPSGLKTVIRDQNRISSSLKKKISILRVLFSNKDILCFDIDLSDFDSNFITSFKKILKILNKTIIISGNYNVLSDISDIIYKLEKN